MTLQPPTIAQRRVLAAVATIGADGWPVNVREVQRHLGYASPTTPHALLGELERKGYVQSNPRWKRRNGWRVTDLGTAALTNV